MTEWLLIAWMLARSNAASTVPFVADRYASEELCKTAGMAWRTADRDTYRATGFRCIPAGVNKR